MNVVHQPNASDGFVRLKALLHENALRLKRFDENLTQRSASIHPLWWVALLVVTSIVFQCLRINRIGLGVDGGFDIDPRIYSDYALRWLSGKVPYRDFVVEYPPASLLVFVLPALFFPDLDYRISFAIVMVIVTVVLTVVTWIASRKLWPQSFVSSLLVQVLLFCHLYYLSHLTYRRYDLAPTVLVLGALCFPGAMGSFLLGLAVSVKLWPAVLAPLWLSAAFVNDGRSALVKSLIWMTVGCVLPAGPFLMNSGLSIFDFLFFHQRRGIQIESVWAVIPFVADLMGVFKVRLVYNFGADHLAPSTLTDTLAMLSTPVLGVLTMLPWVLWLRRRTWQLDAYEMLRLTAATIIGFMLASKVFSPQYVIWTIPFSILASLSLPSPSRWVALACVYATPILTKQIFPRRFPALRDGPRGVALIIVMARLVCLVTLYVLFVRAKSQPMQTPVAKRAS